MTAAVFMGDPQNTKDVMLNAEFKTATLFAYIFQCYDILVSDTRVREYVTANQVKDFKEIVKEHVLLHNAVEVTRHYQKAAKARRTKAADISSSSSAQNSKDSTELQQLNIADLQTLDLTTENYDEVSSCPVLSFKDNAFKEIIKTHFDNDASEMIADIIKYMVSPERKAGDRSHPPYVYDIQDGLLETIFTVLKEDGSEKGAEGGVSTARKSLTTAANVILSDDFLLFITGTLISKGIKYQ